MRVALPLLCLILASGVLRADEGMWTFDTFVHTVDTNGGNSGSPIVNKKGERVGLLFGGSLEGRPSRYHYDLKLHRSVSVDARGIVEALDKLMDGGHLVKEILGK